jgi:hypothetical protein
MPAFGEIAFGSDAEVCRTVEIKSARSEEKWSADWVNNLEGATK